LSVKEVEGQRPEFKGLDYKVMRALVERCVKRGWVKRAVAKKSQREDGGERIEDGVQGAKKHSTLNIQRRTSKGGEVRRLRSKPIGGSGAGRDMGAQLDRQDACPTTEVGA